MLDDLTNIRRVLFRHLIRLLRLKMPMDQGNRPDASVSQTETTQQRECMRKRGAPLAAKGIEKVIIRASCNC